MPVSGTVPFVSRCCMDARTENRLDVEGLPVKIWGMDAVGQPFVLNAIAREVSYRGARLDAVSCKLVPGEIIGVQYGSQKGRFRLVWVGNPASQSAGQAGIRSVEDTCIWESELANVAPELHSGELDSLSAARRDRRQYPRFRCSGNVQLRRLDCQQNIWTKLADISLGGCYVDTTTPEAVGAKLHLDLHIQDMKISAIGEVRTAVPALGMGVQFTGFEGNSREFLKRVVEKLSPPKLAGRPQPSTSPEAANSGLQALLGAVRDHFEGNNIMSSEEFEAIVKAIDKPKPASPPVRAATVKSA